MAERLKLARERSKQRKELLKHTLGVDDLGAALGSSPSKSDSKPAIFSSTSKTDSKSTSSGLLKPGSAKLSKTDSLHRSHVSLDDGASGGKRTKCDVTTPDKNEDEFRDSTAFLKGTQSLNPHNDYSQNFVDTGQRPQNFIRDVGLADRFDFYLLLSNVLVSKGVIIIKIHSICITDFGKPKYCGRVLYLTERPLKKLLGNGL